MPLYLLLKNHIPPIILFLLAKDIKIFFEECLNANPPPPAPNPRGTPENVQVIYALEEVLPLLPKLQMTCSRGGAGTRPSIEL